MHFIFKVTNFHKHMEVLSNDAKFMNLIQCYVNDIANIMCKYKDVADLHYLPFTLRSFVSLGYKYMYMYISSDK